MDDFKHTLPVETKTINGCTGEVTKVETTRFGILPPPSNKCQVCAVAHEPHLFHDCQSLFYQYAFYGRHGRWPTWADASAHCSPEVIDALKDVLLSHAPKLKWSEPEEGVPLIAHLGEAS